MDLMLPKLRRRRVLQAAAGLALAPLVLRAATVEKAGASESVGAAAGRGKPGDFDFLSGEWRIDHRRQKPDGSWDEFKGEATCWGILGGVGSVEELRIPARSFSGMGLRLLDVEKSVWSDFWVNGKSGVLTTPGQTGVFADGVGTFGADDMDGTTPIKVRGIWDRITPRSCRWYQSVSRDGGRSWEDNWYMDWTRA